MGRTNDFVGLGPLFCIRNWNTFHSLRLDTVAVGRVYKVGKITSILHSPQTHDAIFIHTIQPHSAC